MSAADESGSDSADPQLPPSASGPETNPVDLALDLLVYAPLGALLELSDRLPQLAKRGREKFESQAPAARMIGQFAVGAGRKKVEDQLGDAIGKGKEFLQELGVLPPSSPEGESTANGTIGDESDDVPEGADLTGVGVIDAYGDMTAIDIVPMLSSLDASQRSIVRSFEAANRARGTILARLDELDASDNAK